MRAMAGEADILSPKEEVSYSGAETFAFVDVEARPGKHPLKVKVAKHLCRHEMLMYC
jgi:hypothetical protein